MFLPRPFGLFLSAEVALPAIKSVRSVFANKHLPVPLTDALKGVRCSASVLCRQNPMHAPRSIVRLVCHFSVVYLYVGRGKTLVF